MSELLPDDPEGATPQWQNPPPPPAPGGAWFLESFEEVGKTMRRVMVEARPFRVGRRSGLELSLPSDLVSKEHAELVVDGAQLRVRDLGSTNGTFVNRERVGEATLRAGDIVHFAHFEFRVGCATPEEPREDSSTVDNEDIVLPNRFKEGSRELDELLKVGAAEAFFQPILRLGDGQVAAYEALGRGRHRDLPESPLELFAIAATMGAEVALSQLFRKKAVSALASRATFPPLFLNIHPVELHAPSLVESLAELQQRAPHLSFNVEVHETAVTDPKSIGGLRETLRGMSIGMAYDDFGAGQARLLELGEVPPDYLKFDMKLIRGIDEAPASRVRLLGSLVRAAKDLGVKTVAEGVETHGESKTCIEVGFDLAQGYLYGWPVPIHKVAAS